MTNREKLIGNIRLVFQRSRTLTKVVVGNGAKIGEGAFNAPIYMATYENTESLYYYRPYTYYLQDKDGNYINEEGEIISNSVSYEKFIALGENYKKLIDEKLFKSKIHTSLELMPEKSSISSVKIGSN